MTPIAPKIGLIYARARNGVIGKNGVMPWHLPEDLAHFKRTTLNHPVVMGRKTWDSLPPRFRPLPGRTNIVISRQADWKAEGALHATSLQDALRQCQHEKQVWIIGGAQIYAQALALAHEIVATEIDATFEGDAYAPTLDASWRVVSSEDLVAANGLRMSFVTYRKAPEAA